MNKTKNEATRVRLSAKERAALQEAADRWGGTISDALRWAIRVQYIDPPALSRNESKEAPKFHETGGASFGVQS